MTAPTLEAPKTPQSDWWQFAAQPALKGRPAAVLAMTLLKWIKLSMKIIIILSHRKETFESAYLCMLQSRLLSHCEHDATAGHFNEKCQFLYRTCHYYNTIL